MILIYSYSTKIGNYSDNEWVMNYFRASIKVSKKLGYKIKLYGCQYAYSFLNDLIDYYVDVTNENFILTDDLKMYIHSKEEMDCITIDGDIILGSPLYLPTDCDVLFETKLRVKRSKIKTKFNDYLEIFKKYPSEKLNNYFHFDGFYSCNVGLLKFNNQEVKNLLLKNYYDFREKYLQIIEPNENLIQKGDPAIIVCEYNFACIIEKEKIDVKYCIEFNNYRHYMSTDKLSEDFKKHIEKINNIENKII